jgi:hypothetical protein
VIEITEARRVVGNREVHGWEKRLSSSIFLAHGRRGALALPDGVQLHANTGRWFAVQPATWNRFCAPTRYGPRLSIAPSSHRYGPQHDVAELSTVDSWPLTTTVAAMPHPQYWAIRQSSRRNLKCLGLNSAGDISRRQSSPSAWPGRSRRASRVGTRTQLGLANASR